MSFRLPSQGLTPSGVLPWAAVLVALSSGLGCGQGSCGTCSNPVPTPTTEPTTGPVDAIATTRMMLKSLSLPANMALPADPTNRFADDERARELGKKFFFEPRFSGALLDDANNGTSGTNGRLGETGKVSCSSCHSPQGGSFSDMRSPRGQLSLGSGWTHRKAPSLLNVAQSRFLMWDGRRDSAFSQVFSPMESPLEFNSSRLFVAQQVYRLYRSEYEALFGAMPALLDKYPELAAAEAGCTTLPADPAHETCVKPEQATDEVTGVVVNVGKAIQAYTRQLSCGRTRFDDWLDGNDAAMTPDEIGGAVVFANKGACQVCHSGPYLTDQRFHNLGLGGSLVPFTGVMTANDPGAGSAAPLLLKDPLNSRGKFSDGDDARLDSLPSADKLEGAFKTPGLRCVSRRRTFMHNGEFRSLNDVIDFFDHGSSASGFVGTAENFPRNFTQLEKDQLLAFLHALDGEGPPADLLEPPTLAP
jgi:cytochrome c peroxidase